MVRWLRWHCPPDTGFDIRALAVWGRARYPSVTDAPHNTNSHTWMGKKQFCFFQTARPGTEPRTLAWKAAVLTTALGPPPSRWSGTCRSAMCHVNDMTCHTTASSYARVALLRWPNSLKINTHMSALSPNVLRLSRPVHIVMIVCRDLNCENRKTEITVNKKIPILGSG